MKQRQEDCNSQVITIEDMGFFREVLLASDNNLGSVLYRIVACPFSARNLLKQCGEQNNSRNTCLKQTFVQTYEFRLGTLYFVTKCTNQFIL